MRAVWWAVAAIAFSASLPGGAEAAAKDGAPSQEQIRQWIRELGAEAYRDRVAATEKLKKAGSRATEDLRGALDKAADPEVRHRLWEILHAVTREVAFEDLSAEAKAVARRPYETSVVDEGRRAQRKTYCVGDYGISDLGNIRIAVKGLPFSGSSSSSLAIKNISGGSGSTGSGNRRFTTSSANGVAVCTFGGVSFTVTGGKLRLDGREFSFGKARQVIFVSSKGKIEGVVKVGAQPEQNAEDR
jgi:hypothetical protein